MSEVINIREAPSAASIPAPSDASFGLSFRGGNAADLLIRGAHVLDPRTGFDGVTDVLVQGGEITEIGIDLPAPDGAEVIEAAGKHLFPGFVDPHVHLRTPGFEYKEDIESGTRSAAAGGFCLIVAMANTEPPVDNADVLRSLRMRAATEAHIPVGFSATVTRGMDGRELTEMAELADAGAVCFTDDGVPIADAGIMSHALQYQRLARRVLALHEEDPALSRAGVMHEGEVSAQLGFAGIPPVSESSMIARDALLADYEGGRIHVQHLSSAESVEIVREAKRRRISISCEATPHHLTLTDAAIGDGTDANFKMNPPLRTEADRLALIEGLRDGTIDCIATDHAPHAAHEKDVPFEQASMGVTGLETSFPIVFSELVKTGVLPLELVIERMTSGAALLDLPTPRVAVGEQANLALIDLEAKWTVGEEGYESRSANSCFAGRTVNGRVLTTVAAGVVAYRARTFAIQEVGA
ncbi:MAG TPA: dihydroorotase [Solirubrobacterales bacterium]|jgi:dihydroorotase|nr:dihydroorotase [Solirubrobacterales bacterium]